MSPFHRAGQKDRNQNAIVAAMRKLAADLAVGRALEVVDTSGAANGFPDLVVWYCGETLLVECKVRKSGGLHGRLRDTQVDFIRRWPGEVHIVEDAVGAVVLLTEIGREKDLAYWSRWRPKRRRSRF